MLISSNKIKKGTYRYKEYGESKRVCEYVNDEKKIREQTKKKRKEQKKTKDKTEKE